MIVRLSLGLLVGIPAALAFPWDSVGDRWLLGIAVGVLVIVFAWWRGDFVTTLNYRRQGHLELGCLLRSRLVLRPICRCETQKAVRDMRGTYGASWQVKVAALACFPMLCPSGAVSLPGKSVAVCGMWGGAVFNFKPPR